MSDLEEAAKRAYEEYLADGGHSRDGFEEWLFTVAFCMGSQFGYEKFQKASEPLMASVRKLTELVHKG